MAHTILAYLAHFQKEMSERILPRRPSLDMLKKDFDQSSRLSVLTGNENQEMTGKFDYRHGSVGNFLITGCRLFFKSLVRNLYITTRTLLYFN